jgi:hypothetical protein
MMKKAVPLSMLLASALGQNSFAGTWTAPNTPIAPTSTAPLCCYFTGDISISGSAVTGKTNTGTPTSSFTAGSPPTVVGPCGQFMQSEITNPGTSADWAETLSSTTGSTATNGATLAVQTASSTYTLTNNGNTLTFVPAPNSAAPTGTVTSCSQVFTRPVYSISGVTSATGTPGTGTGGNTCCFLDTTKTVTLAQTTDKRATITATFGSQCANAGEQTQYLKAGTASATAGEIVVVDTSGQYKYTLSADKKTLTFVPPSGSCSQPIAVTLTSSSANKVTAMTSVVVGAAVLGLAAI